MSHMKRPLTPEQQAKSDARRAQFRTVAETIAALTEEQRMAMAAQMAGAATITGHPLSPHNACLLAAQCPSATIVGGFQQWRSSGRMVRKGEHGHMIWAPARTKEPEPGTGPRPDELSTRRPRFVMVTVFDVAQTDPMSQEVAA